MRNNIEADEYEWGECTYCGRYLADDDWITDLADPTLRFCSQRCIDGYYQETMRDMPEYN